MKPMNPLWLHHRSQGRIFRTSLRNTFSLEATKRKIKWLSRKMKIVLHLTSRFQPGEMMLMHRREGQNQIKTCRMTTCNNLERDVNKSTWKLRAIENLLMIMKFQVPLRIHHRKLILKQTKMSTTRTMMTGSKGIGENILWRINQEKFQNVPIDNHKIGMK